MSEPMLPPDLAALWTQLEASESDAADLARGLSDEQFNWQPNSGERWSIAQCLDHLARINFLYAAAMREAIDAHGPVPPPRTGPLRLRRLAKMFVDSIEPPVRRRFKAPAKLVPAALLAIPEALAAFRQSHDPVRDLLHRAAAIDCNRVLYQNPFIALLKIRVSTGLLVIPAHDRRHLWQARQVKDSLPLL